MIKVPEWLTVDDQMIDDGEVVYDIASVIFQARNLKPFDIPLCGMRIDYIVSNGNLLDFVKHMKAVLKADLTKPIILDPEGWVIDGRHRIAKAILNNQETVLAVRFEDYPKWVRKVNDNA